MIQARLPTVGGLLLVAPVRGLRSEVAATLQALDGHRPAAVGVGLSGEELASLQEYFVRSSAEPVVPLTSNERSEVRGLVRFGEVSVPNPAFLGVLHWAEASGVPTEGLDPTEDETATLFAEHIGYLELVRRTVRERSIARRPPTPNSADEFALTWDRSVAKGRGSREYAAARDLHLARSARRLAVAYPRVAVVVDRERFDSVRALLEAPAG